MTSSPPKGLIPKHKGRMELQTQIIGVTNIQSMFCFSQGDVTEGESSHGRTVDNRLELVMLITKPLMSLKNY